MQVRSMAASDINAVYQLLQAHGWAHRIPSVDYLTQLVAASQRVVVAVEGQETIGFARAITDGLSNGYLSMVVVAPHWRRQGVGQALVQHIVASDVGVTWVLRAGRAGAPAFFAKLGFVPSTVAMERPR